MKFSMIFEAQTVDTDRKAEFNVLHECVEQAVLAEKHGFDRVWAVEHEKLELRAKDHPKETPTRQLLYSLLDIRGIVGKLGIEGRTQRRLPVEGPAPQYIIDLVHPTVNELLSAMPGSHDAVLHQEGLELGGGTQAQQAAVVAGCLWKWIVRKPCSELDGMFDQMAHSRRGIVLVLRWTGDIG